MLTREQKAWLVTGFCNTDRGCSDGCALYYICKNNHDDFIFYEEAELDACLRIIAPNVLDESKSVAAPQWVSAANPPEKWHMDDEDKTFINYLVVVPDYGVDIGNYVKPTNTWFACGLPAKVTHWMPLPEPTEEDKA